MPRQTTSLVGPRSRGHATATPQITWLSLLLSKCMIEASPSNRFVYEKDQESSKRFFLYIGLDNNDPYRFMMQIKDDSKEIFFNAAIPSPTTDIEIRLFEDPYTIDVRHFKRHSQMILSRWTFYLELQHSTMAGRAQRGWTNLSDRLRSMSISQVRFLNIPRPLHLLNDESSSERRYAFSQEREAVAQSHSDPSAVTIEVPRLGIKMVYTGVIASPEFRSLCDWVEFKRKPPADQTSLTSLPALTEQELEDPEKVEEHARQMRKRNNDANTVCGQCYRTGVPIEIGKIRAKRDRKEWIGCQKGAACGSHNFWFHLTEECAGFTSSQASKKMRWWCVECRKDRPRANELGLEQRPGARQ